MALIPGIKRFNLHAIYLDTEEGGARQDRAKALQIVGRLGEEAAASGSLQPSCFSHPNFVDGMTLAHPDPSHPPVLDRPLHRLPAHLRLLRRRARERLRDEHLVPDGMKDMPADRSAPRERLIGARRDHERRRTEPAPRRRRRRANCSASAPRATPSAPTSSTWPTPSRADRALPRRRRPLPPTEVVSDKITAVMPFVDHILLHVTRWCAGTATTS